MMNQTVPVRTESFLNILKVVQGANNRQLMLLGVFQTESADLSDRLDVHQFRGESSMKGTKPGSFDTRALCPKRWSLVWQDNRESRLARSTRRSLGRL